MTTFVRNVGEYHNTWTGRWVWHAIELATVLVMYRSARRVTRQMFDIEERHDP